MRQNWITQFSGHDTFLALHLPWVWSLHFPVQTMTPIPFCYGDILPKKTNLREWMRFSEEDIYFYSRQSIECWFETFTDFIFIFNFFTVYYCWPSLCSPIMCLQFLASINMIGRNKYETKVKPDIRRQMSGELDMCIFWRKCLCVKGPWLRNRRSCGGLE